MRSACLSSLVALAGLAGCNDTAVVMRIESDRAGAFDAICVEADAGGAARFGRRYELAAAPLPQTLTALASGRASMQALVYGLRHGVEAARARREVPFRGNTVLQVELPLDACVPETRTPAWMAAGSDGNPADRAALVPSADASADAIAAFSTGQANRFSTTGLSALPAGLPAPPTGAVRQILSADLDADCRGDLVVLAVGGPPVIATRAATGEWAAQSGALPPLFANGAAGVAAGDVDGDGNPDLLIVGGAEAHLLMNDGAGHFHEQSGAFDVAPSDATAVALGDLDGDGHLDAVIAQGSAQPGLTRVYLNDADGTGHFTQTPAALPPLAERASALALDDVDGDGALDLVVAHLGGPVRLYLNRGNAFLDDRSFAWLPDQISADVPTLLLTDLDGDCHPDLVIARAGAAPLLWLNTGAKFVAGTAPPVGGAAAGAVSDDVDGDGLPDLLFFGVAPSGGLALFVQR